MASDKQIRANRLNSLKSTGPRSEAGKSITRMNALKFGIHAQSHVIRGEDPEALAQLAAEYNAEFHPVTPRQRDLVDILVHNEWKIRRLRAIETDLWAYRYSEMDDNEFDPNNEVHHRRRRHPLATAFSEDLEKRLENLQRRLHAYERSTTRALKQLRDLSGAGASACQPAEGRQPIDEPSESPTTGSVPVEQAFQPAMPAFEPACPREPMPASPTSPPLNPADHVTFAPFPAP